MIFFNKFIFNCTST